MSQPPLPHHPEPHTYVWTKLELESMRAYGQACREQALEEAARVCETYPSLDGSAMELTAAVRALKGGA